MTRRFFTGLLRLVAAMALTQGSGCTLIGLGIGAGIDARKSDQPLIIPGWMIETVKPGTKIAISLQDSSQVSGTYTGLTRVPAAEYAERYAIRRAQQPEGQKLPTLGDQITVRHTSGEQSDYELVGFDYRRVWPSSTAGLHLSVRRPGETEPRTVDLKTVHTIVDRQGATMDAATLSTLMSEGHLPLLSAIVVKDKNGQTAVAIDQVSRIAASVKKHGKQTGAEIGAALDGIAVLIAIGFYIYIIRQSSW